ncbi:MAG: phage major capsid protein [Oscillospiraceae bacterium]|nr:phage major capsid protein [Oscillospiraceae bacterium]
MALKQLLLSRKIAAKRSELEKLETKKTELEDQRSQLATREAELETAVNEITEETPEEERAEVDKAVEELEGQVTECETAQAENDEAAVNLRNEIDGLQQELDELNRKASNPAPVENKQRSDDPVEIAEEIREERKGKTMIRMLFKTAQERAAFLAREDVKNYLTEIRSAIREKRAVVNAGLTIPDVMLDLIRHEIAQSSKLLPFVRVRSVGGKARQNVAGAIPEAVWTEMCASINELTIAFNQVEVDGYKVGGYIAICNAVLEDSDYDLAAEIVSAIGGAISKALDKAILFGTGIKMPTGIVTRLAQTSQPASWGTNAPAWTDLHTSNIKKLNIGSETGAAFFAALIENLGIAKDYYNVGGLFWVMNRKTHIKLMSKALAFNSAAALVANTEFMPVLGGAVIEFDDDQIADNEIIGGFGGNYLLAERAGIEFASSDLPLFLQDQTVFKGTARYDGMPVAGEAFVVVNFANTDPTTSADFPEDEANSVQEIRLNTHTGAITGTGTLQLKAITKPGKGTVTWASSATGKATVSSTGLVTGVTAGTTVITATCNGLTDSCTVTVS